MKWFYLTAAAVVVFLTALPMLYLRGETEKEYQGLVVRYDSYGSAVKSLDPATCGDTTSASIQGNCWEGLYTYHYLKRPPEVVCQLAAELPEISDDGLTYTVRLRPDVLYHRNPCFGNDQTGRAKTRAVRAGDFVLSLKRIADCHVSTDLSWAFLSGRVVGLDEYRARTEGVPSRFVGPDGELHDIQAAFGKLDGWRKEAAAAGALPQDLRKALKEVEDWRRSLHLPPGSKDAADAFDRLAEWARKGEKEPVRVADVSAALETIDRWRGTLRGYPAGDFSRYDLPVEGVQAVDDLTLRIRLNRPFPQFLYVLAMHVYAPVPREAVDYWLGTEDDGRGGRRLVAVEKRSTEFREAEQIVGTGPYVLKTFERKHKIVLMRNPDYRDDFYPSEGEEQDEKDGLLADAGKKVPFIDVLHYDYVAEDFSAWNRFLAKQTDAGGIPKETFQFVITPDRQLAESWRRRHIYLKQYSSPAIYWIVFNMEDPVLSASTSLRQALCLAFDVENYIKVLYNGRGKRAVNVIPSTFKGHAEAGAGPYHRLDMDLAREKIEDARKELGAAGKLVNGQIPELKFEVGDDQDPRVILMSDFVKQQFAKVGVKVKVVFNDWPTLQQRVHNKLAQMYTMGWHADYPDAENFLQLFYSPNIPNRTNNANYTNARFDELYRKAAVMPDTPERTRMYAEMASIVGKDCPVLLITEAESYVLIYEWLKNVKSHPIGYGMAKYQRIDTDLRKRLGGR